MTTDLFKTVLWNDGEGITSADLSATGMFGVARMADQILEHLAGGPLATADMDLDQWGQNDNDTDLTSLIYTMTGGEAVLWSSGTNVLKVTAGTIFQKVANATGEEPTFLPFTIRDSDLSFAIADNATGNPLIDIVQVKLELVDGDPDARDFKDAVTGALSSNAPDKTRRVQATVSVKRGASGATPTYPTPDAGYALLGAVRVPTGWVSADEIKPVVGGGGGSEATIRQCSVPLRIEGIAVHPHEFDYALAVSWARDVGTGSTALAPGAGTDLWIWCPVPTGNKRIVGVTVIGAFVGSGAVILESIEYLLAAGYVVNESFDLSSKVVQTGALRRKTAHLGQIADCSPDSNPSAANGPIGDGMWACGGMAGPGQRPIERWSTTLSNGASRARLNVDGGAGSYITSVIWYLAG